MKLQECKLNKININNFDDLILFFNKQETTIEHIKDICQKGLNLIVLKDYENKEILINTIFEFWYKWKNAKEKPIFLDIV